MQQRLYTPQAIVYFTVKVPARPDFFEEDAIRLVQRYLYTGLRFFCTGATDYGDDDVWYVQVQGTSDVGLNDLARRVQDQRDRFASGMYYFAAEPVYFDRAVA